MYVRTDAVAKKCFKTKIRDMSSYIRNDDIQTKSTFRNRNLR